MTVIPLLVGGSFLAGFLVLLGMWMLGEHPGDLPGLFDFPSAYVGDSVLLPLAAGLLAVGGRHLPRAAGERVAMALPAIGAGGAMAAVQLLWLADDTPRLNWTLPAAHQFNAAGVWHAVYAVGAAATMAALVALLLYRSRAALRSGRTKLVEELWRRPAASIVTASLLSYGVLATHDSWSTTSAARASLVALGAGAAVLVLAALCALGRKVTWAATPALHGLLAGAAVGIAATAPPPQNAVDLFGAAGAVLGGIGAALLLVVPRRRDRTSESDRRPFLPASHRTGVVFAAAVLAVVLPGLWLWAADSVKQARWTETAIWLGLFATMLVLVPMAVMPAHRARWLWDATWVLSTFWLLGAISLLGLTAPRWHQTDAEYVVIFVVTVLTSGFLFKAVWLRFEPVLQAEQRPNQPDGFSLTGQDRFTAGIALLLLVTSGLAAAFSLLSFTISVAAGRRFLPDSGAMPQLRLLLGLGATVLLLSGAMLIARRRGSGHRLWRSGAPVLGAAWAAALLLVVGMPVLAPVTPIAVLAGLVLALWAANTAINNVALLNGVRVDRTMLLYAVTTALSGFLSGYLALTAAIAESPDRIYTWFSGVAAGAAILAVHGALTVAGGALVSSHSSGQTRHSLMHNLLQDSAVMTLLYWIGLVIPATTLIHLPPEAGTPARFLSLIVICAPFLTYFLRVFLTVSSTNMGHLQRELTSRAEDVVATRAALAADRSLWRRNVVLFRAAQGRLGGSEQHRFLRILGAHLRNQNALARAAAALFVVGIMVQLDHLLHRPDLPGTLDAASPINYKVDPVEAGDR